MLPFATDRVLCERASEAARRKGTVKPIHDGRGGFGTIPVPPAVGGGDDMARGKSLAEQQVKLPTLHICIFSVANDVCTQSFEIK